MPSSNESDQVCPAAMRSIRYGSNESDQVCLAAMRVIRYAQQQ